MNHLIEKTMVLIKPDAMERGLAGEILSRFERVMLKIVDAKLVVPDQQLAEKHYPVTEEWLVNVGGRTKADCEKYGLDVKETMGTDDPKKIGELVHQWNVDLFLGKPILAFVLEGPHAVEVARKICGNTIPLAAAPGTIRGDFSSVSAIFENGQKSTIRNLVHASGDVEEAKREIGLWFGKKS